MNVNKINLNTKNNGYHYQQQNNITNNQVGFTSNIPQATIEKEINALKLEQEKQMQNMQATIDKAKAEISKEQDPAKIAQLEEKYRNEINKQKLALDTSYNNKLTAIDNKIKTAVVEKARSMNYNMVLPKNTVLFGGDDITEQVATIIK